MSVLSGDRRAEQQAQQVGDARGAVTHDKLAQCARHRRLARQDADHAALLFTGGVVGILSGQSPTPRALRQLVVGYGAAGVTYLLGLLFGTSVS